MLYRPFAPITGLLLFLLLYSNALCAPMVEDSPFDIDQAVALSRAAIGTKMGQYSFLDHNNKPVFLSDFKGKPLVISLIYTSCHKVCAITTSFLNSAVLKARDALGEDSFNVVTIGFDSRFDRPQVMGQFARHQGINDPNWHFLSGDAATIDRVIGELGFTRVRSPQGFDHIMQATIVDAQGVVHTQVYGDTFDIPLFVSPLKELVLGIPQPLESALDTVVRRVRFYCTTFDPTKNAYHFNYSIFVGMAIGFIIILSTIIFLFKEWRYMKR